MPDIIDLISSDPPLPERPRPHTAQPSHSIPRRPSHRTLFSSDSIDASFFNYDNFENPLKKRKVSNAELHPSPRSPAIPPKSPKLPVRSPVPTTFHFSDDEFAFAPSLDPKISQRGSAHGVSTGIPRKAKLGSAHTRLGDQVDAISLDGDGEGFTMDAGTQGAGLSHDWIDDFSDPFSVPEFADMVGEKPASKPVFSSKTAELLSSLKEKEKPANGKATKKSAGNRKTKTTMNLSDICDEEEEHEIRRTAKKPTKMTTEEKEAKAKARAQARAFTKAQKDIEREKEKERKQKLKEEKAKEKQKAADISEVNKLKVDKKDSTPEMIIDIASSLEESSTGNQTVEFMRRLGVEHTFFASTIPNIVKWRRKVKARYNEAAGHWEPCTLHIKEENHVLCLVPAQDFVDMVIASTGKQYRDTLELHVLKIRSAYPEHKPIYLIEGLTAWMRKNRNSRNRAYQAEVLAQFEQPPPGAPTGRGRGRKPKNKPETTPPVDDDTIEDALLSLQVTHSCLIHHSSAPAESAEWIKNFTEHVSTIPYRRERMEGNDAAFCMDVGQVKSGEDKLDTFVKMLQEVNRVTASMAYGIAGQYPCVTDLVRGMRIHGPTMLEDVRVCISLLFRANPPAALRVIFFGLLLIFADDG